MYFVSVELWQCKSLCGLSLLDSLMERFFASYYGQTHLFIIHLFLFPSNLALARLWHARDEDSNRKWHAPVPRGNNVCCCSRILYFCVCVCVCVEEGDREHNWVSTSFTTCTSLFWTTVQLCLLTAHYCTSWAPAHPIGSHLCDSPLGYTGLFPWPAAGSAVFVCGQMFAPWL